MSKGDIKSSAINTAIKSDYDIEKNVSLLRRIHFKIGFGI